MNSTKNLKESDLGLKFEEINGKLMNMGGSTGSLYQTSKEPTIHYMNNSDHISANSISIALMYLNHGFISHYNPLKDKNKILPCATYLEGEYGIQGLFIGVPVKLGAAGVKEIIQIDLTEEEHEALHRSARAVGELVEAMTKMGIYSK